MRMSRKLFTTLISSELLLSSSQQMRVKAQEWQIVQELAPSIPGAGGEGGTGGVSQGPGKKIILSKTQKTALKVPLPCNGKIKKLL